MSEVDVQDLLSPVSGEDPLGPDLGNSAEYAEFIQRVQDPGAAVVDGADDADDDPAFWRKTITDAEGLLRQSKDIWIAVYLAMALVKASELSGLAQGLAIIRGLIERYSDQMHPRKDPDDLFPIQQINALGELAGSRFLKAIRKSKYCESSRFGVYTVRDFLIAAGHMQASNRAPNGDLSAIKSAFEDFKNQSSAKCTVLLSAIEESGKHVNIISEYIRTRCGPEHWDDLIELSLMLRRALEFGTGTGMGRVTESGVSNIDSVEAALKSPAGMLGDGTIQSREDVRRALQRICDYYERNEPASPVPVLAKRAMKLVSMDFMQVVRDLLPEQISTIEKLGGIEPKP
jgi:type VI secretion system protein ImpA